MTEKKNKNFVDYVVRVGRVTKVTKGGKQFSFAAFVVTGDQQGSVGMGLGKSREASLAIAKAIQKARKNMINVPLRGKTIPYNVLGKHGASSVIICPASAGTGVIAGGGMRAVMEAAGILDVLAKSLYSPNPMNVVKATFNALSKLRSARDLAFMRDKTIDELIGKSHVAAE